jgi:NADPH-dependent FMN reductase
MTACPVKFEWVWTRPLWTYPGPASSGTEPGGHLTCQSEPLKVAMITGSTRPGRKSDTVAGWVYEIATKRDDAVFEIVDLVDYALPLFDERVPPMAGRYMNPPITIEWSARSPSLVRR